MTPNRSRTDGSTRVGWTQRMAGPCLTAASSPRRSDDQKPAPTRQDARTAGHWSSRVAANCPTASSNSSRPWRMSNLRNASAPNPASHRTSDSHRPTRTQRSNEVCRRPTRTQRSNGACRSPTRTHRSNGACRSPTTTHRSNEVCRNPTRTHRSNEVCRNPTREVATPGSVRHRSSNRCCHRNGWSHPRNLATPQTHWMSCEGIPHRTACRSLTIPLDRVSLPRSEPLPPYFTGAHLPRPCYEHSPERRRTAHSPPSGQESRGQADPRKRKGPPQWGDPFRKNVRQRPTLPQGPPCSTIGAEKLSFRVRNGTGRFPLAMTAETLLRYDPRPYLGNRTVDANIRNDCEWTSPRPISTGQLHTLPCFHFRPINPVVYWGPYQVNPVGVLILERASRLDAFSGYHFRT